MILWCSLDRGIVANFANFFLRFIEILALIRLPAFYVKTIISSGRKVLHSSQILHGLRLEHLRKGWSDSHPSRGFIGVELLLVWDSVKSLSFIWIREWNHLIYDFIKYIAMGVNLLAIHYVLAILIPY